MTDAGYEDAQFSPLRLRACDQDDLRVVSAMAQDAVFKRKNLSFDPGRREFALLLNRVRWEIEPENHQKRGGHDRVRSVLKISDILDINISVLAESSAPDVFSLLSLAFENDNDIAGSLSLILSGDREILLNIECIEVSLTDVADPYPASSKTVPNHS